MNFGQPKKRSAALFFPISSLVLGTFISCFSYATPSRGTPKPEDETQQEKTPSNAEVAIEPGAIALTRIPSAAQAIASDLVNSLLIFNLLQ